MKIPRLLRDVLDRAEDGGRRVSVWWRDDDATADGPELARLLALASGFAAPLAIAAVPGRVEPSLADRLREEPSVAVLVHGWSHANHAPPHEKSAEFGPHRPLPEMSAQGGRGLATIREVFGDTARPVFVPPWNRLSPGLIPLLAGAGYCGLSTFGPRLASRVGAMRLANTHLDPVDWRGSRGALEPEALAAMLDRALAGPDRDEPIGLLTHHLVFDEALWRATAAIMEAVAGHPAVRLVGAGEIWPSNAVIELSSV